MSDIDLTAAVEAAADSLASTIERDAYMTPRGERAFDVANGVCFIDAIAQSLVETAAPLIAAQVREQVAREIEAQVAREPVLMHVVDWVSGIEDAAAIARGQS